MTNWYQISQPDRQDTPALLVFPRRIKNNIDKLKSIGVDENRLRPHIKTIKCGKIVELLVQANIHKIKCSTIAEAELAAMSGVNDVLLAYQPAGTAIDRFCNLAKAYPETVFSTIVDNTLSADQLAKSALTSNIQIPVYIDIDIGMHRTGTADSREILSLAKTINTSENLIFKGLHAYDGHIHDADIDARNHKCRKSDAIIERVTQELESDGLEVEVIVAGGTPTLLYHQQFSNRELGAGTPILWDHGYQTNYPELDFEIAAVVATRVISKPGKHLVCLDLGYKALASEMPWPRAYFPDFPQAKFVSHSEEHLVLDIGESDLNVGDIVYAFPTHICPTVALHENLTVVEDGKIIDSWPVEARKRKINI